MSFFGPEFEARLGMRYLNAELFVADGEAYVRCYDDATATYHTWHLPETVEVEEIEAMLPTLDSHDLAGPGSGSGRATERKTE